MKLRNYKLFLNLVFLLPLFFSCNINLTVVDVMEDYFDSSTLIYTSEIKIEDYPIDQSIITHNKNKSVSAYYYFESIPYYVEVYEGNSEELLEHGYSNYSKELDVEEDLNLLIEIDGSLRYQIYLNDNSLSILTNLLYMVTGNFLEIIDSLTINYALLIYTYSESESIEIYLSFENNDYIDIILTTS